MTYTLTLISKALASKLLCIEIWMDIMQKLLKILYDSLMILLIIVTILTLWSDNEINSEIHFIVWLVFAIDFIVRFALAKEKWQFIKKNPFLIIAVIPLDQFFQLARIVRIFYLFRIKTITKYYIKPYLEKLERTHKLIIICIIPFGLWIEALIIWRMDNKLDSWNNAIIEVFSHLFLFAKSIEMIQHFPTIILLSITSILGVLLQGLALQWFFTKIEDVYRRSVN